jgi:hypothetical protein
MSFIIYNKKTVYNKRGKPALLRFSKYGHIQFSSAASKLLGLKEGMRLSFMTDNRDKGIIYFFEDAGGLNLRQVNNGKRNKGLQICCRSLSLRLLDFFGFKDNKSFDVKADTLLVNNTNAWFVLKENVHKPIQWKKRS